jgi:hypothetical protein
LISAGFPDTSTSGRRVARELAAIVARRGKPGSIVSDNGTESTCSAMLVWCKKAGIDWHFIALDIAPDFFPVATRVWRAHVVRLKTLCLIAQRGVSPVSAQRQNFISAASSRC